MAMQQINLYQSQLQKRAIRLSSAQLLKAVAMVTGLMLGLMVFYTVQLSQLEVELKMVEAAQAAKMTQLENLQTQVQARQKDKQLQARVDALMLEISNKQKVMKVLGEQRFGNSEGFTAHVSALARQRIEGLWLTQVRISQGGETLGMKGQALKAELLPRYLQRLSTEAVFTGKTFETLSMLRNQEQPSRVDFELYGVGEDAVAIKKDREYVANKRYQSGRSQ